MKVEAISLHGLDFASRRSVVTFGFITRTGGWFRRACLLLPRGFNGIFPWTGGVRRP